MEHVSPLDAAFLDIEDVDKHAVLAIALIAVVEGPPPDQDEFLDFLRGRLPLLPRYRQKARQLPFALGQPVWVDDPAFDLAFHVRRVALPAPGDDAALRRLVAWIMSQRLDRDRPLWECWVVEGLADNRWAVLTRAHHCLADGISGTEVYRIMFDESAQPRPGAGDTWRPEPEPSSLRLFGGAVGGLIRLPALQVRLLAAALRRPAALARRIADTARGMVALSGAAVPVSKSSLAGQIGQPRDYGMTCAPLADVIRVAKDLEVTVNDVVLAAVSGAFRTLLLDAGEAPGAHAIRTLVPVSMRATRDAASIGNQISVMLPLLPIDVEDPIDRLREVHKRLAALKASKEAEAGAAMTTLARYGPFPPISLAIRLAARLPHRNIVTVTTNVPGSPRPLHILGRRITAMLPYVPIALRLRTGIAMLTYDGQVSFGVTTDLAHGPRAADLARAIDDAVGELLDAAGRERPRAVPVRRGPRGPAAADAFTDADLEDDASADGPRQGDERTVLVQFLRWQRATLEQVCSGLTADELARRPVDPTTLSLLGLVRHMADVERIWFRHRMAGQDAPPPHYPDTDPHGGLDGTVLDPEVVAQAWDVWRSEVAFAERFVADAPSLDILGHDPHRPVSLRWVLMYMAQEYARHNGHADLARARIDEGGPGR